MTAENSNILTLSSFDELFSLLKELTDSDKVISMPESFAFEGELETLKIHIEGEQYHSSIPGSFARGIWEYQESVYRAVAYALYQTSDLRKLTNSDFEKYNLVFNISEGSAEIWAIISQFCSDLGGSIKDMSDNHKLLTILGIVAILAYGINSYTANKALVEAEVEIAKIEAGSNVEKERLGLEKARLEAQVQLEKERTRQFQSIAQQNPIVNNFYENTGEGTKSLLKHASNATELSIGRSYFDSEAIQEAKSRSAREVFAPDLLKEHFKVLGFKRPDGSDTARFNLLSSQGEISAILDITPEGPFTPEQLHSIFNTGHPPKPIFLTVDIKTVNNEIKQAYITEINLPDDQE